LPSSLISVGFVESARVNFEWQKKKKYHTMINVKGLGRSCMSTSVLLILLLCPLFAQALDDDAMAKGGRGGGGGSRTSSSGSKNKGTKMIKLGKLNVALWVVIVVGGEYLRHLLFTSPRSGYYPQSLSFSNWNYSMLMIVF
jgi:hypothetical protein